MRCGLTAFDAAVLLIVLAQQLDRRYGRLYAYLQDDLTKPFATPGLALDLLCRSFLSQTQWRARLQPEAPLFALGLLQLGGDDSQSLRQRPLQMEERVVGFLLGSDAPDAALPSARLLGQPDRQLMLSAPTLEAFSYLRDAWSGAPLAAVPLIAGEVASGRRLSAQHLANYAHRPLLTWSASTAVPAWRPLREALLTGAVLGRTASLYSKPTRPAQTLRPPPGTACPSLPCARSRTCRSVRWSRTVLLRIAATTRSWASGCRARLANVQLKGRAGYCAATYRRRARALRKPSAAIVLPAASAGLRPRSMPARSPASR